MSLWYIYIFLVFSNVAVGIFRWKSLSPPLKALFFLVSWAFIIEMCQKQVINSTTGNRLAHTNMIIELSLQCCYYYFLLHKKKRPALYVSIAFFIIATAITYGTQPRFFDGKNFLDGVYLGICVSFWTGLFFLELIKKPLHYSLKSDGNFWVNCGNILFYPGTLMLFGLGNYLAQISPELKQRLHPINYALNLILYLLYLIAFLINSRPKDKNARNA